MKLDRTPLAIVVAGVLICGAVLTNGYFERAARDPARFLPSKSEVQKTLEQACHLYKPQPKNVYGAPTTGKEVTAIKVTHLQPSMDGGKVLVSVTYGTFDGNAYNTDIVLDRDDFGRYRGTWQHDGIHTPLAFAD